MPNYARSHLRPRPESVFAENAGVRRSVQALLDLVDTQDPAWPAIAAVLQEFVAAGVTMEPAMIAAAVKVGKGRWAAQQPRTDSKPLPPSLTGSIVYYARRRDMIKIGTTARPRDRFRDLVPDEILAIEPGGHELEGTRHDQFAHLRGQGEYFREAPDLHEHIRCLQFLWGEPDPAWRTSATLSVPREAWRLPLATSTAALTAAQAEVELGIPQSTIRNWRRHGRILPAGHDERRRMLFYAEHLTLLRDSPRSRMSGVA